MSLFGKSLLFVLSVAAVATNLNAASTTPPPTTETPPTTTTTLPSTTTTTTSQQEATSFEDYTTEGSAAENATTTVATDNATTTVATDNAATTVPTDNATTTVATNNATTTVAPTNATITVTTANATSTTTVAPEPPFNCHDCNSGSPLPGYWRNTNCAEDGYVVQWYTPNSCSTFCFSSVGLYPAGTVFRGCATALYLPDRELQDGCFDDVTNNRHVCLCSGDDCNTHDLTSDSEAYVQEYVAMQQAGSDNTV
ncbi:uncharacterized protein LOC143275993 [Babylonia areolata]|uniref:uncharacterized protein LOC143275993 n=1 Tax=Babylonia areolata TaxID=304850 RepID=UPI003FD48862